jgi:hypothetical protein
MSHKFTHYFDELQIVGGLSVYASGEADISYCICKADPDVGYFDDYVGDIEVENIRLNVTNENNATKEIESRHWLHQLVYDALTNDFDRLTAICEHDASEK